jgi:hypothetical protein
MTNAGIISGSARPGRDRVAFNPAGAHEDKPNLKLDQVLACNGALSTWRTS